MASTGRRPGPALIDALFAEPHRFDFAQAVRILEAAARRQGGDEPLRATRRIGEDAHPAEEAVRLRAATALRFPVGEVAALVPAEQRSDERRHAQAADYRGEERRTAKPATPPELVVNIMGLAGPSGVLPQHYSETLLSSLRARNMALRDFFDLFNHRLISLFLRAMGKYRLPALYERHDGSGDDPVSLSLRGLIGLATPHLRGRQEVPDETLLYFSGAFAHAARSAAALEAMLSEYFRRPVTVAQFQGHWLSIAADERSRLAGPDDAGASFCTLGDNAVIGERVWDVASTFRIVLGPLTYSQFASFLPEGRSLRHLAALVQFHVGPGLGFDVQLILMAGEVPALQLGAADDAAPRLGWNTWLRREVEPRDRSDTVFTWK